MPVYSHQQVPQQQQQVGAGYDLHQQVYRPTQEEWNSHNGGAGNGGHKTTMMPAEGQAGPGQAAARGKAEERMDKLEKGVGRFLKKLDKKW